MIGLAASREAADAAPADGAQPVTYLFKRMVPDYCGGNDDLAVSDALCVAEADGATPLRTCEDGTTALAPLFRRPVDPLTGEPVGGWSQIDAGGCPGDPPTAVVVTETDFRALPLAPSPVRLQPVDGHGLVNVGMILVTDPAPQVLTTTILGIPVTVTATPVSFAWDLGDGSAPIVTAEPGAPYPNQTVTGLYTRHGDYALTLTTTWTGTYRVAGSGPQRAVVGTAVTVSAPVTTHIHQAHSHLVANP